MKSNLKAMQEESSSKAESNLDSPYLKTFKLSRLVVIMKLFVDHDEVNKESLNQVNQK